MCPYIHKKKRLWCEHVCDHIHIYRGWFVTIFRTMFYTLSLSYGVVGKEKAERFWTNKRPVCTVNIVQTCPQSICAISVYHYFFTPLPSHCRLKSLGSLPKWGFPSRQWRRRRRRRGASTAQATRARPPPQRSPRTLPLTRPMRRRSLIASETLLSPPASVFWQWM